MRGDVYNLHFRMRQQVSCIAEFVIDQKLVRGNTVPFLKNAVELGWLPVFWLLLGVCALVCAVALVYVLFRNKLMKSNPINAKR